MRLLNKITITLLMALTLSPIAGYSIDSGHTITPNNLVRKIAIHGARPYLKIKILRLSSLQSGDEFNQQKLEETRARLTDYFIRDGYLNTKVEISAIPDKKKGFTNISIDINRGEFHRIGTISVSGNEHIGTKVIKNDIGPQSRYSPKKLRRQVNELERDFMNKGFIRARVKIVPEPIDGIKDPVNLNVTIKERKRLNLKFNGNTWFRDSTLKNQTTFFKEKTYDLESVSRSKDKLLNFYHANGFLHVQLQETINTTENDISVAFDINEGPRTRLKIIDVEGRKKISNDDLFKDFKNETHTLARQGFLKNEAIEADVATLLHNYHNNGFFDAQVLGHQTELNSFMDQAVLTINVSEGVLYKIGAIEFKGIHHQNENELLNRLNIKSGKIYNRDKIEKGIDKLTKYFQTLGYPLATVQSEELIHTDSKNVDLMIHVFEGPQVSIGQIFIEGLYETKEKVVLGALKFKTGDLFSYNVLLRGQFNLKRMDIFDHVSITPLNLDLNSTQTDILVRLKERKRITFDAQAGFDSEKLGNGQIILTRRNLFGLGKHVQIRGEAGFALSRGEITFLSPRLFGASWNLVNQYFIQFEDDVNFNAFSYGGSIGVLKHLGRDVTLLLKNQITRFDIKEAESNAKALQKNLFDNTFAEVLASISFDTRDNYADPHKGLYSVASTELDTDLSHLTNDFVIFKLSTSHYLTPLKPVTLSNTFRLGHITKLSDGTRIPATKIFFMGGNDTVRGFTEDAILDSGGTTSLIYNTELTIRLIKGFQLAGFFDMGSLTNGFEAISQDSVRESIGMGLRYITPVGPIRLDYGFILDRKSDESLGRLHFTFGYFF
ncbi:MAG: hypothetical protein ACD_73C00100G0002 [uncultured bacterium]|nr:MAG: hypothetical protein ACD_73C00100G0002 [uncultured bacterium]